MPDSVIDKFISGQRLSNDEFIILDKLLNEVHNHGDLSHWLEKNWEHSQPEIVNLQFEQIQEQTKNSHTKTKINRLFKVLVKVAAVLFMPLLATTLYFYVNHPTSSELLTLSTQKGEQTSVILPDGSEAWLNVDTKLSYPVDYGVKSRKLELVGEAYFEVEKNKKLPFEVTSGDIITKALGTRFIVSAYPESSEVKSSLIDGSVEVKFGKENKTLKPGQQLVLNKKKSGIIIKYFNESYELAWKNDVLVFRLTSFDNVIVKLEKWYDINIEYNPVLFKSETLTVRFEKYETLEQVLRVIAKANEFKYTIEDRHVKIIK